VSSFLCKFNKYMAGTRLEQKINVVVFYIFTATINTTRRSLASGCILAKVSIMCSCNCKKYIVTFFIRKFKIILLNNVMLIPFF
jgi:hypothetical protein